MTILLHMVIVFTVSMISLIFLRKLAILIDLIDKPIGRKNHQGEIPLVGGISVYLSIAVYIFLNINNLPSADLYFFCISILVFTGVIDDKFDINFKLRFVIQSLIACAMIFAGNISLISLGKIIPHYELTLGYIGNILTIIAVLAAINAFNMTDGIDGLLGILSISFFSFISIITYFSNQFVLAGFCLAFIVAIIPFLFFNLGVSPCHTKKKVFMGDAGSMLIGFTVIWVLLQSTQIEPSPMQPVTALWLIALPLMDLVTVMLRRVQQGKSMFKPDREHLHHIFMRAGLSPKQTLIAISALAIFFGLIGLASEYFDISEWFSFLLFIGFFTIYTLFVDFFSTKIAIPQETLN